MRTVITVEARMGSARLPGKVLAPLGDQPMLVRMLERLGRVRRVDGVVVATTNDPADDPIVAVAEANGAAVFRGDEIDVMGRVLGAARAASADLIVELTGDCPLIDPALVDQVVDTFRTNPVDYCANVLRRTYPRGMDVQVFPTAILADAAARTSEPAHREHVSLYIYEHPDRYRLINVASGLPDRAAGYRLTVDTEQDLAVVRGVFDRLYPVIPAFGLGDMLAVLDADPSLSAVNREVRQRSVRMETIDG